MVRFLTALLALVAVAAPASGATVCVDPATPPGCVSTIQEGVDTAASGDVVIVAAGTYAEHVVVPVGKRLGIHGAGPAATVIDAGGSGTGLEVLGPNLKIAIRSIALRNGARGLTIGDRVKIEISDCSITGNVGSGGIDVGDRSTVAVTACAISGNTTTAHGAGIRSQHALNAARSRVTVASSTISGNGAGGSGGGIYSTGKLTLVASSVDGNTASANGGGIFATDVTVERSTISRNASLARGGGLYSGPGDGVNASIRDSTISGNTASDVGGGLHLAGRALLEHTTVADNTSGAEGGGVAAARVTLKGSLIADNSAPIGSDCSGHSLVRAISANLVENVAGCPLSTPSSAILLSVDPILGPLLPNGGPTETHALQPGSPAVGIVTSRALCKAPDQRGNARTVPCDLGAYEAP